MRKVRVSLRHTGSSKPAFGVTRMTYGWGYNLDFGFYFLAIRDARKDPPMYKRKFIDLEFGRSLKAEHERRKRL